METGRWRAALLLPLKPPSEHPRLDLAPYRRRLETTRAGEAVTPYAGSALWEVTIMKAMLLTGHGGPEMLRYGDAADPTIGPVFVFPLWI